MGDELLRLPLTPLGRTGLTVSRLCLGTGTTTFDSESAQSKLAVERFGRVLLHAHAQGITFWDTSDNYGTHAHVAWALRQLPRASVQITSKTYAVTAEEARHSVQQSLRELGTDYIDILLMHEPDSPEELAERAGALAGLQACKAEGLVRAVGLSTHAILTLETAAGRPDLDVLLTNYNLAEVHMDAGLPDYTRALEKAHAAGQGVIVMKTLGEGKLAHRRHEAIPYNLTRPFIDAVVVGMMDEAQVDDTLAIARPHLARPVNGEASPSTTETPPGPQP
ncbi:MAG: aldo/keto reductase [Candidatus Sericytochromatia bacterium]|nr:aldo/keto reductase [Candidatus Sericytochromatia bacterium]